MLVELLLVKLVVESRLRMNPIEFCHVGLVHTLYLTDWDKVHVVAVLEPGIAS